MATLYNKNSGNVIMSGTPEYELAALEGKPGYNQALAAYRKKYGSNTATTPNTKPSGTSNTNSLREELEAYSHEELVKYYKESIDPDGTEDLSGMDEADLIEAILERVQEMTGGKGRRRRKQRKTRHHNRKTTYKPKRKQRKSRKNRRN